MKKILLVGISVFAFSSIAQQLSFTLAGRYTNGNVGACEISTYDATSKKLFVTNAADNAIDIIDLTNIGSPALLNSIDITTYGGGVNSVVNLNNGYFAAAIEAVNPMSNGKVVFFTTSGVFTVQVDAGVLPDMITVTKDGNKVLVANEGQPSNDYLTDPEGSVTIIDISGGVQNVTVANVTQLDFSGAPSTITGGLKKPGTTWAEDLEPEYIAVSADSEKAVVTCQENNVFVMIDLTTNTITGYKGLGFKDHSVAGFGLDPSNSDSSPNIATWNVKGVYQPDATTSMEYNNATYWLTANEGDARDYAGYSSEARIKNLILDATVFPNAAALQADLQLGRLKTFTEDMIGDTDGDGDVDELYSYGARSFSIWNESGNLVWDSGDQFEQYIATNHPAFFNCDEGLAVDMDSRSDDKGPEPEAITTGTINGKTYAFVGLERTGGIMVYDVSNPLAPSFDQFINTYQSNGTSIDAAPEGILFIPASASHTGKNLLFLSHEVSGTVAMYTIIDPTQSTASVDENGNTAFNIYPNPTTDELFISSDKNFINSEYTISNAVGSEVAKGTIENQLTKLNVNTLPNGVYFIRISNNNAEIQIQKVIKQ